MNPVTEEGNEKNLFSRKMTAIWKHPLFQSSFQRIQEWEKDRIYCRHGMEHFLDTIGGEPSDWYLTVTRLAGVLFLLLGVGILLFLLVELICSLAF